MSAPSLSALRRADGDAGRAPSRRRRERADYRTAISGPKHWSLGLVDLRAGLSDWRVWTSLAWQDIQLRYRRSFIGPFWISLSLAILVLSIGVLYAQIFQVPFREYVAFVAVGFLVWGHLLSVTVEGCSVLTDGEQYLKTIPIPLTTLVARMVTRNVIIFAHNIIAVLVVFAILGTPVGWTAILVVPGLLLLSLIGAGLALMLGPICLRFRDIPQIVTNGMQAIFFLTPVLWMPGQMGRDSLIVEYNPFYHLIQIVRGPLLEGQLAAASWGVSLVIFVLAAVAGCLTVSATRRYVYLWF